MQRTYSPWNLPPEVWRTLSTGQKKLWVELKEAARVRVTGSGTPCFQTPSGRGDQYDGINSNRGPAPRNRPNSNGTPPCQANDTIQQDDEEESAEPEELTTEDHLYELEQEQEVFERDNLNDSQRCWLSQVRQIWHVKFINQTRTLDVYKFKESLPYAIKTAVKGKGKLMADGCADTSVAAIGNGFC